MRFLLVLLLAGCASFDDHQFCKLMTEDEFGARRCHAWELGPTREQSGRFDRKELRL